MEKMNRGIVASRMYFKVKEFEKDLNELENNPDFTLLGQFKTTQDADEELEYQGFTLKQISIMSVSHYGNVIETLEDPETNIYWVFVGAR